MNSRAVTAVDVFVTSGPKKTNGLWAGKAPHLSEAKAIHEFLHLAAEIDS